MQYGLLALASDTSGVEAGPSGAEALRAARLQRRLVLSRMAARVAAALTFFPQPGAASAAHWPDRSLGLSSGLTLQVSAALGGGLYVDEEGRALWGAAMAVRRRAAAGGGSWATVLMLMFRDSRILKFAAAGGGSWAREVRPAASCGRAVHVLLWRAQAGCPSSELRLGCVAVAVAEAGARMVVA